jgi:hypothetical protein
MTARHTDSLFVKSNSEAPAQYDAYLGPAVVALLIADIEALSLVARQFRLNGNVGQDFSIVIYKSTDSICAVPAHDIPGRRL